MSIEIPKSWQGKDRSKKLQLVKEELG